MHTTSCLLASGRNKAGLVLRRIYNVPVYAPPCAHTTTFHSITKHHQQNAEGLTNRTTLNPERSEQTESGTDDEVASHPASFDPSKTDPECAAKATKRESQQRGKLGSPLDTSPANRDVSEPRDPAEGGAERNAAKERSAKGWTRKQKSTLRNHDG